jgi:hypothetical protein
MLTLMLIPKWSKTKHPITATTTTQANLNNYPKTMQTLKNKAPQNRNA